MLIAYNRSNCKQKAWEVQKSQGPFYCPECRASLLLKKGKIRNHHFAHIPPFNCQYGGSESDIHYKTKKELFNSLSIHQNVRKCELERRLYGVRPDVSFYIKNYPIAIEIQKSSILIDDIIRKAIIYNRLGINLLYIFPEQTPKLICRWIDWSNKKEYICRPNQWEKFLHSMFFGRVYYYSHGLQVYPYHFNNYHIWIDYNDFATFGGGYFKLSKSMKKPIKYPNGTLNIINNFHPIKRQEFDIPNFTIPACRLWIDDRDHWW